MNNNEEKDIQNTDEMYSVIEDILNENMESAFLVCNIDNIVEKYKNWKAAMPRIKPFYAVKCNPHPAVLQTLVDLKIGFDCATKYEIEAVLKLGMSPNDIIFANPVKDINHINYARSNGVWYTTFDSVSELEKCKNHYSKAKHLIRIKTNSLDAIITFDNKFGCDAFSEAPVLLRVAKKLNLEVVGVAFHVGSGCHNPLAFSQAIKLARYVFIEGSKMGYNFSMLDIGGGFIGNQTVSIFEVGDVINKSLDKHFPNHDIQVIAEPGRYFVSAAFTLVARVISVKSNIMPNDDDEQKYLYYIDNGIFGLFYRKSRGEYFTPIPWKKGSLKTFPCTVFGPTMAPFDIVAENVMLPKLYIGDWVVFKNIGEYSLAVQTQFHGFTPPPIFFVANNLRKKNFVSYETFQLINEHTSFSNDHKQGKNSQDDSNAEYTLVDLFLIGLRVAKLFMLTFKSWVLKL